MILVKPSLFVGREYFFFGLTLLFIMIISLSFEYYHYSKLTQFDDAVVDVLVLKHYSKSQEGKVYDVLKLRSVDGALFYITSDAPLKPLSGYTVKLWMKSKYLGFLDYIKGFVTRGRVISISREKGETYKLGDDLLHLHKDVEVAEVYGALFFALPMSSDLQQKFSMLGVSHLLAISGFHLGVLSFIVFTLLQWPYRYIQQYFFPFRHRNRDLFFTVAIVLGLYLLFLGEVPSLLRAYVMLIVGFFLHDRGFKIVSMQTLGVTIVLLLALWPRLFFSMGFWLSVSGVYYIFLYLYYFEKKSKYLAFVVIPLWVYLLMTPISLLLFGNYSLYHPFSVFLTVLFTLFYPLALFLHLLGWGELMDGGLTYLLGLNIVGETWTFSSLWLLPYALLSLATLLHYKFLILLLAVAFGVSVTAIYQVT